MATSLLPSDFKEFLKLLNSHQVEYLLIGGYAVGYYGYARATTDMDIWIAIHPDNADKMVAVLHEFGFGVETLSAQLFLTRNKIIRMGLPPFRIEILTNISGVEFAECFEHRTEDMIDGTPVNIIGLQQLKTNKRASARHKDLDDLENLP
jgi:predicted nucleotidyltransferase